MPDSKERAVDQAAARDPIRGRPSKTLLRVNRFRRSDRPPTKSCRLHFLIEATQFRFWLWRGDKGHDKPRQRSETRSDYHEPCESMRVIRVQRLRGKLGVPSADDIHHRHGPFRLKK